ncbi:TPA: hypothetical protein DDW35_05470 [Candidatus Sumerlaeota bacterium]|jgi:uncharacterized protein (TIGR00661 family)|nr:hypothetical protein [Candidatus Sumerlaeota bacterium]
MAKVLYGLAGEGRGHATRVKAVADELLRRQHEVLFLTGGDALPFLKEAYQAHPGVRFIEAPVLRFSYKEKGTYQRVALRRTLWNALGFWRKRHHELERIAEELREHDFAPHLVVGDYEPLACRLARRMNAPFISLDNQHYFAFARLSSMAFSEWAFALSIRFTCRFMCPWKKSVIISRPSSHGLRLSDSVHWVGPLIRREICEAATHPRTEEDFILCYLRPSIERETLEAVRASGKCARVYGLGEHPTDGAIEYCRVSAESFTRDLLHAGWVVSTAGNQTLGECLLLKKKTLLIPEPGQMEQKMNAAQAKQWGVWAASNVTIKILSEFLRSAEHTHFPHHTPAEIHAVDILENCMGNIQD